jgi:hypothetical protein
VLTADVQPQGKVMDFRGDQSLRLVLGNAAAVKASCNGHDLGSLGSEGQVASRVLTLNDPACASPTG